MYLTDKMVAFIRDAYLAESKYTSKRAFAKRLASHLHINMWVIRDVIDFRTYTHVACNLSDPPMEALRSLEALKKLDPFQDDDVFMDWPSVF